MTTVFRSINPKNNKLHRTFEAISNREIDSAIERSYQRFRYKYQHGDKLLPKRFEKMTKMAQLFRERKEEYAALITQEMGKPITQSRGEVNRCITHLEYYVANTERFLQDEHLDIMNPNQSGSITHQPLGPTLAIMPWNFPLWVPFKAALPPLVMGNSIMMKHAPGVPLCALAIQDLMNEVGFDKGEYINLFATEAQCEGILADRRVRACKFTGSTRGGQQVAVLCAKHVKKGCFELGGSDPFVVLKDANMEQAVNAAYASRMGNSGQTCVSAKRFIITAPVYDEFKVRLLEKIKSTTVIGDPMDDATNLGPLAAKVQKQTMLDQVARAQSEGGAKLLRGDASWQIVDPALKEGNFVDTFVLEGLNSDSQVYGEEFFGPVFNLFKVDSSKEALDLANKSDFGLASTVFTEDVEKAEAAAKRLRTGIVFVNDVVVAGSEYPTGGIKGSGYGRESYSDGLLDMANRKTIIRRNPIE